MTKFDLTKIKVETRTLADFDVDRTPGRENVRDEAAYTSDSLHNLKADLLMQGQTDAILSYTKPNGKLGIVRGFRRFTALEMAATAGETYQGGLFAGEVVNKVRVAILPSNLTEAERTVLMFDHSQRRSLNKAELQRSVEKCLYAQEKEIDIVVLFGDLFDLFYPPKREIVAVNVDGGKDRLNYHKGTLQTMKRAWASPTKLHDLWMKKLSGEGGFPSKSNMETLADIHIKEQANDKTGKINRDNPGPLFEEKWAALLKLAEDAKNTPNAPKPSISMRNREQTVAAKDSASSRVLKVAMMIQLGDIPIGQWHVLDLAMVDVERGGTVENLIAVLDSMTKAETSAETSAETPLETGAETPAETPPETGAKTPAEVAVS